MAEEINYMGYEPETVTSVQDVLLRLGLIIIDNTTADGDVAEEIVLACLRFIRQCPDAVKQDIIG